MAKSCKEKGQKNTHGQTKDALAKTKIGGWRYDIIEPGYKYNMTDIQASIGLVELARYEGVPDCHAALLLTNGTTACIDGCLGLGSCVRACPFHVPFINADGYSEIDPAKCHGCGVCAAECPAKAIQLMQYEDDHLMAKLDGLLEGVLR